jgi:FdhD protein
MSEGAVKTSWEEYRNSWKQVDSEVIEESILTIYLNGRELATMMCSPNDQDMLALGFLKNEGLLGDFGEIELLHVSKEGCCVDVWLDHAVVQPERFIITTGCGGGVTFDDPSSEIEPLQEDAFIEPEILLDRLRELHLPGSLHARSRGVHTAGLSDGEKLLVLAEDIGRHNTLDKLLGMCLRDGIETRGRILLATGRVSSEMMRKAAHMGCPIIASRNSPTSMSVAMARAWNITLVGYVRGGSMRVYSHAERLKSKQGINVAVAHEG